MTIDIRIRQIGSLFSGEPEPGFGIVRERQRKRDALFRETAPRRSLRLARSVVASLKLASPQVWARVLRSPAADIAGLPDPAPDRPVHPELRAPIGPGACDRLMEAYARGLCPGVGPGIAMWRSPQARLVAPPQEFKTPKSVRGHLRRRELSVVFDRDFETILARCARPHGAAWLSPALMRGFCHLFDCGFAHCFAVYDATGTLRAGGFGVAIGRVFVTQAMFGAIAHHVTLGLTILNRQLERTGFTLHDGIDDPRFVALGFTPLDREPYHALVAAQAGGAMLRPWDGYAAFAGLCREAA